jgi:hypothetical protein
MRNAKQIIEWLNDYRLDGRITEEEVFEELSAEGVDVDDIVEAARTALQRILDKVRVVGVPADETGAYALEGDET